MPVTTRPEDKFAFLFTGPTDQRYRQDLINVVNTLRDYYNYPADNIWVVWGGPDNIASQFPAIPSGNLITLNSEPDPKASFGTRLTAFLNTVNGNTPDTMVTGALNTALVYFTGTGYNGSGMVIKPGTGEVVISSAELQTLFNSVFMFSSGLNIVMQQNHADSIATSISSGIFSVMNRTLTWVNGDQSAAGNATDGGFFTRGWCSGLKQDNTVNYGGPKYPDQLPVGSGTEPFLVNLEQAKLYSETDNSATYGYYLAGEDAFLGRPRFHLEDGGGSVGWWESPSVYLTHPNSSDPAKKTDLYITDALSAVPPFNNTINVDVRNTGTHPVRTYRIGVQVFRTPFGGASDFIEHNNKVPVGIVLKPTVKTGYNTFSNGNLDTWIFNTPFYTGTTHECIKAKVVMSVANPATDPFDWNWTITVNDNEAQRNTDQGSDPPVLKDSIGEGNSFRGSKRHLYQLHNPFSSACNFMLITTPEFNKALKEATMEWFIGRGRNKWEKIKPEKIENGFDGILFTLAPGEIIDIVGEFGFRLKSRTKRLRMPVEVVVDRSEGIRTRKPMAKSLHKGWAAVAGFTIILVNEPSTMIIRVIDKGEKPVKGAFVTVRTINRQAYEKLRTNDKGLIELKGINPDVYRIKACLDKKYSDEKIVELEGNSVYKGELILNR